MATRCQFLKSQTPARNSASTSMSEPKTRKAEKPISGKGEGVERRFVAFIRSSLPADHLGHFDSKTIIDDHNLATSDESSIDEQVHRGVGRFVQLDDRADTQLQNLLHR